MKAIIKAIEYVLPDEIVTNEQLAEEFPEWTADKISQKIGIEKRHVVNETTFVSDLSVTATEKLFIAGICSPNEIDFILLCTQSPDYVLPTTACIIQERLGCRTSIGAMDYNLGCSGYIYGLVLAKALIETGQVNNVLLLTAETYSKYLDPKDKSVRAIFGDAAAATYVVGDEAAKYDAISLGEFGTDGSGAKHLIVKGKTEKEHSYLEMNGPEIFLFTLKAVPELIKKTLLKEKLARDEIDLYIFHQANEYMLRVLQKKLDIPNDKFYVAMKDFGNTVSATIPIAIKEAAKEGRLRKAKKVLLVGFGVGLSWGATVVDLSCFEHGVKI